MAEQRGLVDLADMAATGAEFSACRRYRYRLWRHWRRDQPILGWVMLNPSTAAEQADDPTVRLCAGRARLLGYGGIEIGNLYAWCATHPADLKRAADPVGPENDRYLAELAQRCRVLVLAWGVHADPGRARQVVDYFRLGSVQLVHLGLTRDGAPRHPLRVPYSAALQEYRG